MEPECGSEREFDGRTICLCAKISEILKLHETLFHEQPVLAFELAEGSFTRPI